MTLEWAVALVLLFVVPLMVTFIIYLMTINHQLADIRAKLSPPFTGETDNSKQNHGWNSYLKKLFPWRSDREARNDKLVYGKHDETDKESRTLTHEASISRQSITTEENLLMVSTDRSWLNF